MMASLYMEIPQVDKFRIDGWKYVSFTLLSIREIDPHAQPSIQENITKYSE